MTGLYFIGDSHISCVVNAAKRADIEYEVGLAMDGGGWATEQFVVTLDELRLFGKELGRVETSDRCTFANIDGVVVTTVGFHTAFAISMICGLGDKATTSIPYFSKAVVEECAAQIRSKHMDLMRALVAAGKKVVAFPPPPRHEPKLRLMAKQFDDYMIGQYREIGVSAIDPREFCLDGSGEFLAEYLPRRTEDLLHGNAAYGGEILSRVLEAIN